MTWNSNFILFFQTNTEAETQCWSLTMAVINFHTWRGQCNVRHLVSNSVTVLFTLCFFLNVLHLNSAPETRLTTGGGGIRHHKPLTISNTLTHTFHTVLRGIIILLWKCFRSSYSTLAITLKPLYFESSFLVLNCI